MADAELVTMALADRDRWRELAGRLAAAGQGCVDECEGCWASQFFCERHGIMTPRNVTTKKTCLDCESAIPHVPEPIVQRRSVVGCEMHRGAVSALVDYERLADDTRV